VIVQNVPNSSFHYYYHDTTIQTRREVIEGIQVVGSEVGKSVKGIRGRGKRIEID
jgi:hypothetical protein